MMLENIIRWSLAGLGIVGAILNVQQRRACFMWWVAANIGWVFINAYNGRYAEAVLFAVYLATALLGLANWRRPFVGLELPRRRSWRG